MQEIYLTLWRPKNEVLNTEYGRITHYAWCLKEVKRIPNTYIETRENPSFPGEMQVCLKKKVSDSYFKERNYGDEYLKSEGKEDE